MDYPGTIEVRQHHGTVDGDEAVAWIKFVLGFLADTIDRKRAMRLYSTSNGLIRRTKPTGEVAAILNKKIAARLRGESLLPPYPDRDMDWDDDEPYDDSW